jgi:hypothetical protein
MTNDEGMTNVEAGGLIGEWLIGERRAGVCGKDHGHRPINQLSN